MKEEATFSKNLTLRNPDRKENKSHFSQTQYGLGDSSNLPAKVNAKRKIFLSNWPSVIISINVYNQTNVHRSDAGLKGSCVIKIALLTYELNKAN